MDGAPRPSAPFPAPAPAFPAARRAFPPCAARPRREHPAARPMLRPRLPAPRMRTPLPRTPSAVPGMPASPRPAHARPRGCRAGAAFLAVRRPAGTRAIPGAPAAEGRGCMGTRLPARLSAPVLPGRPPRAERGGRPSGPCPASSPSSPKGPCTAVPGGAPAVPWPQACGQAIFLYNRARPRRAVKLLGGGGCRRPGAPR